MAVRSIAFASAKVTSEVPEVIYTCPDGNVAAIKGISIGSTDPDADDDYPTCLLFYDRSGGPGPCLIAGITAYSTGIPVGDSVPVWVVLNAGDSISASSSDGQEWDVSLFGALLVTED